MYIRLSLSSMKKNVIIHTQMEQNKQYLFVSSLIKLKT